VLLYLIWLMKGNAPYKLLRVIPSSSPVATRNFKKTLHITSVYSYLIYISLNEYT